MMSSIGNIVPVSIDEYEHFGMSLPVCVDCGCTIYHTMIFSYDLPCSTL